MPAALIRRTVGGAPPLATSTALAGFTMPMSLARMDLTGPTSFGTCW